MNHLHNVAHATETGTTGKSLEDWRAEIDQLDSELLRLLNRRARIACALGAIKVAAGLPAYDSRRERQVLARVSAANPGPFENESVARIFRRIILETRRIGTLSMRQQRMQLESSQVGKEHRNGH
jgi:chorismate mutase-like protein